MAGMIMTAPAFFRRAFFILTAVGVATAFAQGGPGAPMQTGGYVQIGKPDQAEGAKILADFREMGFFGYFTFDLRVLPRRGEERTFQGRLWAGRNEQGNIYRVIVGEGTAAERRLLIQNGTQPAIWSWSPGKAVEKVGVEAFFKPMLDGTELTPFELQMPFLYWSSFLYEGVNRVRGRPAYTFLMRTPGDIALKYPELAAVRIQLDSQFKALVQSEWLGRDRKPIKSMTLLDLKKVGDAWIVKSIDFRNEQTRDKTRFAITGAAPGVSFLPRIFEPAELPSAIAAPSAESITEVQP